jgi:hypothetical protein
VAQQQSASEFLAADEPGPPHDTNPIWTAKVCDIEPLEVLIESFLRMAGNPDAMLKEKTAEY